MKHRVSPQKKMVLDILERNPLSRERRNKNRTISYLIRQNYQSLKNIDKGVIEKVVHDILAFDRYWRLIIADRDDLKGRDYNGKGFKEKEQLEQEAQINYGYAH
jgi:hypothetical protein